ncbi:sigma-70 family RNA polymerase sigma factor [Dactylosporangium sp. CA-139066]|uniref:sigma-70 family RNA polymerase sigma factor n=1 Tax=Dactylosporangium sp. CA-139066 TaxID=3239930 RepID=UPI003D8F2B2E
MSEQEWLGEEFQRHRGRLRAVAFRMLGSTAEADDAVQETWLRASRAGAEGVGNPEAWLTTIVARVCLNLLRARATRREDPLDVHVPNPIVSPAAGVDPEHEALLADSVGLALQVVLQTLAPPERLAFVLHDMFAVPFEDIGPLVERSPAAARQLASRARRRVQARPTAPDRDTARQRAVVEAFFTASREGDFAALVEVLDPDVILRSDGGESRPRLTFTLHGPEQVATQALASSRLSPFVYPALVNGAAGVVVASAPDRPLFVMAFTVVDGRIAAVDVLADADRLRGLDLSMLGG